MFSILAGGGGITQSLPFSPISNMGFPNFRGTIDHLNSMLLYAYAVVCLLNRNNQNFIF